MPVLVFGLNYRTAPIGLLERLAVPPEHLPKALASLTARDHVLEGVVLSTCNRVEAYAHVSRYHGGVADVRNFFAEWARLAPEDLDGATYDYHDEQAARHLFGVASGLDSMVVGERQIHLQVRKAFQDANQADAAGRMLGGLFRQALRVGKRTRAETGISDGASSMVDVGLQAALTTLGGMQGLQGRTVLVVGAGKIGGMAAARVADTAQRVLITNRTADKAERLANRVGGAQVDFIDIGSGLVEADLVLCSTGAARPVLDYDTVATAMAVRAGRPLVLLDLAVPRDVEPDAALLPGVTVLDIDAVRELTATGSTGVEAAKARVLVDQEAAAFVAWTRSVRAEPTIRALRAQAEDIRQAQLQRMGAKLSTLDDRQRKAVEALTVGIVKTLLHEPSVKLKALADGRVGDEYAAVLRELFDLPE